MMKEFMLLIRNESNHQDGWSAETHQRFLKACEDYIADLKKTGKLKSAQPLARDGKMISGTKGDWKENAYTRSKEVIVGYYHIFANDIDEAIAIAKQNPEFEFGTKARVEVRPVKIKEKTTGFVYPDHR
jgi:hypothetical protein